MQLKASAPGSMMLLGEYAVLYGKPALVCAVDKRITVTLTPRHDTRVQIHSALLGDYAVELADIKIEKPFQFVLGALQHYQPKLKYGFNLHIESDFSDQVGLGSSAAVTVATLAALVTWLNIRVLPLDLVRQGRRIIRLVQGIGSGADVAASVYGGMVAYQAQTLAAEKMPAIHPLTAWYSGFKTPTVTAIHEVQTYFSAYPDLFKHLCNSIGQCAIEGIQHARHQQWEKLGEIFNLQQGLMESLKVSTPRMNDMIDTLRTQDTILGAKISGSGLGDCVIGLGQALDDERNIPLAMTLQGVTCEKI